MEFVPVVVTVVDVGEQELLDRVGDSEGDNRGDGVAIESEREVGTVFTLVLLCAL